MTGIDSWFPGFLLSFWGTGEFRSQEAGRWGGKEWLLDFWFLNSCFQVKSQREERETRKRGTRQEELGTREIEGIDSWIPGFLLSFLQGRENSEAEKPRGSGGIKAP